MTLHLYFARRFLVSFVRVLALIAILIFVIDTLESVRKNADAINVFSKSLLLAAYRSPSIISEALPIIMMLTALSFCVGLARSSEFVVTRAAGVSAMRSMMMPIFCTVMIGLVGLFSLNPLIASLSGPKDFFKTDFGSVTAKQVSVDTSGLWLRQKTPNGHSVLHSSKASENGSILSDVTVMEFDDEGNATRTLTSKRAFLAKDQWVLTGGKIWLINKNVPNPELTATSFRVLRLNTTITRQQILDGYPSPEKIPVKDIPRFINTMEAAGFSSLAYRLHLQLELARLFLLIAMVIIGSVFMLKNPRLGQLGRSALAALVCGFLLQFLQNFSKSLGLAGEIPIGVAAWFPAMAAIMLTLGILLYLEDG